MTVFQLGEHLPVTVPYGMLIKVIEVSEKQLICEIRVMPRKQITIGMCLDITLPDIRCNTWYVKSITDLGKNLISIIAVAPNACRHQKINHDT